MADKKTESLTTQLYAGVQLTRPLLRHIAAAVEHGLKATGISVGMRAVLEALLHGEASLPDLTQCLSLKRQFVHRMLADAEQQGLVSTRPHPRRKNGHLYQMTTSGRACIDRVRTAELASLEHFTARHDPADIAAFLRIQSGLNRFFSDLASSGNADKPRKPSGDTKQ